MSLVGSLEDLNLGDILQIISLSRKSGVLALDTTGSAGRIVFVDGLVRGASVKGGPDDLRGVLVGSGLMSDEQFAVAAERAADSSQDVEQVLVELGVLSAERIESLCRESVETAVMTMFSWTRGDFSFDVRGEPEPGDPELLSGKGLNAQYLAMESARMRDEAGDQAQDGPVESPEDQSARFDAMSAQELFGVPPEATDEDSDPTRAVEALAMAGVARADRPQTGLSEKAEALAAEIMELAAAVESPVDEASVEPDDSETEFEDAAEPTPDDAFDPPVEPVADEIGAAETVSVEELDLDGPPEPSLDAEHLESAGFVVDPDDLPVPDEDERLAVEPDEDPRLDDTIPGTADEDLIANEPIDFAATGSDSATTPVESVAEPVATLAEPEAAEAPPARTASEEATRTSRALVVIDGDGLALEWVKSALQDEFEPIHIFQQTDPAMTRIRQYLVRGESPMVLIAPGTPVDRLGGVVDAVDFVARLKAQSPRIVVLWLRAEGSPALARMGTVDGVVVRPDQSRIRAAGSESEATALADEFARQLRLDGSVAGGSAAARVISPDALRRLRDTTKALTAASTRGEVLPLVIAFAAEEFARVALFMVRDGKAVGMAQRGLDRCGGPDDAALRELDYPCEDSPWITEMLERGKPSQGEPATEGDRAFVRLLGDRLPDEAYLAPIESTGRVIALLYVDNLPDGAPIEDTNALEVVLHHTGLALDRAALERALHEDAD